MHIREGKKRWINTYTSKVRGAPSTVNNFMTSSDSSMEGANPKKETVPGTNRTGGSTCLKLVWGGNVLYFLGFGDLPTVRNLENSEFALRAFPGRFQICSGFYSQKSGKSHPWTNTSVGGNFWRTFRTIGPYEFPQEKVWTNDWSIWISPGKGMDQWPSKFSESFGLDRYWSIECSSLEMFNRTRGKKDHQEFEMYISRAHGRVFKCKFPSLNFV